MNLKNILWARNTGDIVPDAPIGDNLFGLKLSGGSGIITTATGNPVSIVTNKAQNALDLQIAFSPRQSGSGTPSPDNVRPIVPWTALGLSVSGKNMVNLSEIVVPSNSSQNLIWSGNFKGRFTISFTDKDITSVENPTARFIVLTIDGTRVYPSYNIVKDGYTFDGVLSEIAIYGSGAYAKVTGKVSLQLEVGQTATAYEPYTGSESSYSLGGTYYGGTLDVVTGTLTIDRGIYTFTGNENVYKQPDKRIAFPLPNQYRVTGSRNQICSDFGNCVTSGTWAYVGAYDMTEDEFKTYCQNGNVMLSVPLATPITVTLTPAEVALLAGNNTLWTDGDSLSVTYMAKK